MKFVVVFSLLIASSFGAFVPLHLDTLMAQQNVAMRLLMSTYETTLDVETANTCFGNFLDESAVITNTYNNKYNGCQNTAEKAKEGITAESADQREDLLSRGSGICENLGSCDAITDGLDFFDCYQSTSTDSYRVMFTLNSDAITAYNTISGKYSVIDNELIACVEEARITASKDMDTANAQLQECLVTGNISPPETTTTEGDVTNTPVPTTEPTTEEDSTTPEPTTEEDTTTPEPTTEEDTTTPVPTTEEDSTTPEPTTEEDSSTPEPTTEEDTTTPEPTTEEDSTTPEPTTEEDSSTPEPTTEEDTTTPEPTTEEDSSTPEPTTEVDTTTPVPTTEDDTTEATTIIQEEDLD